MPLIRISPVEQLI